MTTSDLKKAIIFHALTWPIEDHELEKFIDLAKDCGSAELVIDKWSKFNSNNRARKTPALFFEWWELNRPDMMSGENVKEVKKSKRQEKNDGEGLFDGLPWR